MRFLCNFMPKTGLKMQSRVSSVYFMANIVSFMHEKRQETYGGGLSKYR